MSAYTTDDLNQLQHAELLGKLWGVWGDVDERAKPPAGETPPTLGETSNARVIWEDLGAQADEVAECLKHALGNLTEDSGGWTGKAADEFGKAVKAIIRFTREYAHCCDSEEYPMPAESEDEEEKPFTSASSDTKGFVQSLQTIYDQLVTAQSDDGLVPPPWYVHGTWIDVSWGDYYPKYGEGGGGLEMPIKVPGFGSEISHDDILTEYQSAGIKTEERGSWGYIFPAGNQEKYKLLEYWEFNKQELEDCRAMAADVVGAYESAAGYLPTGPQNLELPFTDPSNTDGGFGGGPGAGGGGDYPGIDEGYEDPMREPPPDPQPGPEEPYPGPGGPPGGPEEPLPGPGPEDPPGSPGGPEDPYPGPGGPGGPEDPALPPGPGDPGYWEDPSRAGVDTGTTTARGGVGAGGPGPGGLGGVGPGGAGLGPGGAGAGLGAGAAGGPGAGLGAAGGLGGMRGMGGGMMPMMGGGGAGGSGGDEQERETWLSEDDDVWGADTDAPPPVLGGEF